MAYYTQTKKKKVTITEAQLSTINTTPVVIIAGITGKVINVKDVVADSTAMSAYTTDSFYVSTESAPQVENYIASSPDVWTPGIYRFNYMANTYVTTLTSGDGVVICAGTNGGGGTGDLILYITYEEITL